MASNLITTWSDHDAGLDRVLEIVEHELLIFDRDLSALKLDDAARHEALRKLLFSDRKHRLHIVVQDADSLVKRQPRLMRLHGECPHNFTITVAGESLAQLSDSMLIADGRHALVRFHRDHARAKLIEDDPDSTAPYRRRFEDILGEGGHAFSSRPAGL